ncbi:MAG: hypothetical protein IKL65_01010 [Bacilli bacterium]|nr:hypothetical protein [Bacilli bacterium]
MKTIVFNCNDIKIGINSNNDELIYDLIKKYGNYFKLTNDSSDFNISYLVYENPIPLGTEFKEINETEYNYVAHKDDNLYVFMKEYNKTKEDFVKRIFTNYYIKVLQKNGFIIIHGACVSKNDEAIIFSGNKRCGKTTTLINLLNRGYDFIANDRIAVKKINDEFIVHGIPFSMGIILEDALKYSGFDLKNKKIEIDGEKKKVYVESSDISKMFDVYSKSSGILKSIIVPKYNQNIENINVSRIDDCVLALGNNIMFDNAVPEDKQFMNELIKIKYQNPSILNNVPTFRIEQSSITFDELNNFIKNNIINSKGKINKYDL